MPAHRRPDDPGNPPWDYGHHSPSQAFPLPPNVSAATPDRGWLHLRLEAKGKLERGNGGHSPMVDCPDRLAADVLAFFA